MQIQLGSKSACVKLFNLLAGLFEPGDLIFLNGDLGVGKTYLAKQIVKNLTGDNLVVSPTYNLVHTYITKNNIELLHCDFFRISEKSEIEELGVFEEITKKIIILEWPKFVGKFIIDPLIIEIKFGKGKYDRIFNFSFSKNWKLRIDNLKIRVNNEFSFL